MLLPRLSRVTVTVNNEGNNSQGQTQTRADTDNFQGETLPSMNYFFAFGLVGLIANLCLYPSHCFV